LVVSYWLFSQGQITKDKSPRTNHQGQITKDKSPRQNVEI